MAKKNCIDCHSDCTQLISDYCVEYTGPSFECIDLNEGSFTDPVFYAEAFQKLAAGFCTFLEENKVDLDCLYENGDFTVPVKEAVEEIIDKLCNLSTDDIESRAGTYAIGTNSSTCSAKLTNRTLNWGLTNFKEGSKFTWSFANALSNLPEDYQTVSVEVGKR